jgi:hypothetical protein
MFGPGAKTLAELTSSEVPVGNCRGLHFQGATRTRDGIERAMDTIAVSEGGVFFLFSLRHESPYFDQILPAYRASLATLRFPDHSRGGTAAPVVFRAEGQGGCSGSAESEDGLVFLVKLRGFAPGQAVRVESRFKEEALAKPLTASDAGELTFPVGFGRGDRGTAVVTATTERCTLTLEYKVGLER